MAKYGEERWPPQSPAGVHPIPGDIPGQDIPVNSLRGIALWKFTTFVAVASFIAFKKVYF
ncbi:uncharacterized protein [Drosophila suzukii]|uniref:Uncharacterized protein isoform X2 n=1 Tax=Drosophila suzukii TaxID=28584 RepID=A0AB40DJZ4_DROSZ